MVVDVLQRAVLGKALETRFDLLSSFARWGRWGHLPLRGMLWLKRYQQARRLHFVQLLSFRSALWTADSSPL